MIIGVPFRLSTLAKEHRGSCGTSHCFAGFISASVSHGRSFSHSIPLAAIALGNGNRLLLVGKIPGATMVIGFALTVLYPSYYRREFGMLMMQKSPSVHEGIATSRPWFAT